MRYLSLFSGIGGMDLGLDRAGMTCVGQCEIDPFCRRVLAKHWPNVWRWDDVRTLTGDLVREHCGPIDLICGGFPCQDLSNAGRRVGITGERSGLWSEFHRIIREIRPPFALVENVPELTLRGLDRVLGELAEIGYDAEWDCISAAFCGAPHLRQRLFLVAYPQGEHGFWVCGRTSSERDAQKRYTGPRPDRHANSHDAQARVYEPIRARAVEPSRRWGADQSGVDRARYGVPSRVDRLRGLGNAVVPQVAEFIGRLILSTPAASGKGA